jgi:hypothetical protein
VKLSNSHAIVEINLDEIPLILGGNSLVFCLLVAKVSPFHMNFNLNKVIIATHFDKGGYGKATFHITIHFLQLKELLEKCVV